MTIVLASMGVLCRGRAWANTAPGTYTHCYVNLQGYGSQQSMNEWGNFVGSIANAAGSRLSQGAMVTQTTGGDNSPSGGLIVATISYQGATLTLFISPMDLYLRGIANSAGQVYVFNDFGIGSNTYTTVAEIVGNGAMSFTNGVQYNEVLGTFLGIQSNYNSMTAANNGQGRETLTFDYPTFLDAWYNLAYLTNNDLQSDRAHLARSLMIMIQMTSEAARFNDVGGTARTVMSGGTQQGLPLFQQYLENNWASISSYGWNTMNGSNYAQTFQGINPGLGNDPYGYDPNNGTTYSNGWAYTMYSYADVVRFLAVLLTNGEVNDEKQGGFWEDWNRTEL
jgi:hypothetical protein